MIRVFFKKFSAIIIATIICVELFSCGSVKQIKYFQDLPDTTKLSNVKLSKFIPPVIKPGDILSITILTIDEASLSVVDKANQGGAAQTGVTKTDISGYLVDREGYVEMPILGKIKLENLTIEQAKDFIKSKAITYFNNPIVYLKNKDTHITILGEMSHTGSFDITTEKVSIIDVLSLGGGVLTTGKINDVLLLRQNGNNTISTIRIDLKSSNLFNSPYFYLQNNDVIYVEPNRNKGIISDQVFSRIFELYGLSTGVLATILLYLKK